jgi:hypothetical protein
MKSIILFILLLFSTAAYSQIKLPSNFKLIEKEIYIGNIYSDGIYTITIYPFAHDGFELDDLIQMSVKKPIHTKDDIYILSGEEDGIFYYRILLPQSLYQISLSSKVNDKKFSYYSKWLLNQVRDKRKKPSIYTDGNVYLTDYMGK